MQQHAVFQQVLVYFFISSSLHHQTPRQANQNIYSYIPFEMISFCCYLYGFRLSMESPQERKKNKRNLFIFTKKLDAVFSVVSSVSPTIVSFLP